MGETWRRFWGLDVSENMGIRWMDQQQHGFRCPKMTDLHPNYAHQIIRKWWFEHVWTMGVNAVPYFQANPLVRDCSILEGKPESTGGFFSWTLKNFHGAPSSGFSAQPSLIKLASLIQLLFFLGSCHPQSSGFHNSSRFSSMFLKIIRSHALFISNRSQP